MNVLRNILRQVQIQSGSVNKGKPTGKRLVSEFLFFHLDLLIRYHSILQYFYFQDLSVFKRQFNNLKERKYTLLP
jgi:hypothetical protein